MKKDTDFYCLIKRICDEKGILMRDASFGWVTELQKDGKVRHIVGQTLELNSVTSFKIASDKFACFSVLMQNDVPSIQHHMIFNPETRIGYEDNDVSKAMILFDRYGGKVILKANVSSCGKDVFCITSKEELKRRMIEEFADKKDSLSLCPFYEIRYEYRAIFLDGEIMLCFKKIKPFVVGDGKKTLGELVEEAQIEEVRDGLGLERIPDKDEKVEVSWKHNLSLGGLADLEIEEETRGKVCELAKKAGKAIGARFVSVDIAEVVDGRLLVMEINSTVCMSKFANNVSNGLQMEYEIFSNAIEKMFEG
ncbi:MAG: hypothetical protein IJ867_00545 [Clostridia bacterium]|nr:hypothetical protein [Clostridia bacterium]